MASRNLYDLMEPARTACQQWLQACEARGITMLVYCTYRSPAEQDDLYAQGRTRPGAVVTNAPAWQSWHNVRLAWDAVPLVGGKALWNFGADLEPWQIAINAADKLGIEWAGRWPTFREYVHWQSTGGVSYDEARRRVEQLGLSTEG